MTTSRLALLRVISLAATICTIAACGRAPLEGPPNLRLGRDECGECGMLINEDRCSSAIIVEDDGDRAYVNFDDVGCMLDYSRTKLDGRRIVGAFVRDFDARGWTDANTASFVLSESQRVNTPMGSGILAFADPAAAQALQTRDGGQPHTYGSLAAARLAWLRARYGHQSNPPP